MTSHNQYDDNDEPGEQTEEGTMSFLDHLDELRSRLVRIALFVGIGFVVCWIFSENIYNFLQVPVLAAMVEAKKKGDIALKDVPIAKLSDFIGKEVAFSFPGELRIGNALVTPGTTIKVKVEADPNGLPKLSTASPWLINTETVVTKATRSRVISILRRT